jgi:hypothetical protein
MLTLVFEGKKICNFVEEAGKSENFGQTKLIKYFRRTGNFTRPGILFPGPDDPYGVQILTK